MRDQPVRFESSPGLYLEGRYGEGRTGKGVVVAHPHPLYGGDMNNAVVMAIVNAFREKNHATLRFNFRGVGKSMGEYDDGIGERADVKAAIQWLEDRGIASVTLAGYSFGAWVISRVAEDMRNAGIFLVSPPVDMMTFDASVRLSALKLVIVGDRDEFAQVERVKTLTAAWNPAAAVVVMPDGDHFFQGLERELSQTIKRWL